MKKYLILFGIVLMSVFCYGQCYNTTSYGSLTPTCTGSNETITTAGYATEYSTITVTAGVSYTFSTSIATDFITISNTTNTVSYAWGVTPVVWVSTVTGPVRFHNNTNASCGTNTSIRSRYVKCGVPPVAPSNDLCINATTLPCGTVNLAGTTVGTTNIPIVSGCSMSNYGVWYTFVGDGQITTISTNPSFDIKLSVASGTCGSMSNIICTDASPETGTFTTVLGTTYFVYIGYWSTSGTTTGTFTISRSCVAPPVPTCSDGIQNGTETGIDCGGSCAPCVVGHNIGTGNLNACSGNLFDSGGNSSNYNASENFTETYCSNSGNCIRVTFTSFNTESSYDKLIIYDGPTIGSPIIGTYSGATLPNGGVITSSSGCLTFKFTSDGSVQNTGWRTTISCVSCPVPTCTDGIQNQGETGVDCGGPCTVCPAIIIPTACTNTTYTLPASSSVVFYDDGGLGGDPCSDNVAGNYADANCFTIVTICGSPGQYIIADFSEFAMFNTTSGFDWFVVYDNNTTSGTVLFDNRAAGSTNGNGLTGPDNPLGDCNFTMGMMNYCSSGNCLTFQFWATSVVNRAGWDCLVNSTAAACVLPITLSDFSGYNKNNINYLTWITSTEINNDYFTIDRSIDAINWIEIGQVDGAGNSSVELTYNLQDDSFMSGINYYRLTQTDFNGQIEIFPIIAINSLSTTQSKLLYTIDLIGRRVSEKYNGFRIDVYEDGTVVPRSPKYIIGK